MGLRHPLVLTAALAIAACTGPSVPAPTTGGVPTPSAVATAVAGDCDGLETSICHAAVAEAESFGLFLYPGQSVGGWHARRATGGEWPGCGSPVVTVAFEITPSGQVTVTVGRHPNGQLAVCTY
jgi:hypothetical protein